MTASISLTDQDVFTALRGFLVGALPTGTEIVQGLDNGVPMPVGGFVSMTAGRMRRLETNTRAYPTATTEVITTPTELTIQLDFYGSASAQWAAITQALFRDEYATSQFPPNIAPLYADDPSQMPLVNGEEQYEQRWRVDAALQYNPDITVPITTFNTVGTTGVVPVDIFIK
jgi:hypothetical protein